MALPIVLMTGQLLTDAVWAPLIERWPDRDITIARNAGEDTIAGFARKLLADAPARFALVGHAMGGFVALETMRLAPERVAKLALVSTLASNDGPAQTKRRQGYIDLVEGGAFAEVIEERIPMLFPPDRREDAALLALARRMAADTGAETFLAQQRAIMARVDSRPDLGRIAVPTLLLRGSEDGIVSTDHHAEIENTVAGARSVDIAGTGHLPMVEEPDLFAEILAGFLDEDADSKGHRP